MRDIELWDRLKKFRFDADQGDAPFSVKLAHAEDWTDDYTARVIEEYRKFLYLSQISESQITPSVPVDRAWHMHLTFTKSYWEDLCDGVVGRKLHHTPCAREAEMPLYRSRYEATKLLYRLEFDTAPPEDIWPEDATRDLVFWLPYESKLMRWFPLVWLVLAIGVLLVAFGLLPAQTFLLFIGFVGLFAAMVYREVGGKPKSERSPSSKRVAWFEFEYGRRARHASGKTSNGD